MILLSNIQDGAELVPEGESVEKTLSIIELIGSGGTAGMIIIAILFVLLFVALYIYFERIFAKYADVPIIARSSLGFARRGASKSQIKSFTIVFQGYMARKYGKRFREFIGADIKVVKSQKSKRG